MDDRSFMMHFVLTMDVPLSVSYFYPRLIPLLDVQLNEDDTADIPSPIRTTIEKIFDQGVYLLGKNIFI